MYEHSKTGLAFTSRVFGIGRHSIPFSSHLFLLLQYPFSSFASLCDFLPFPRCCHTNLPSQEWIYKNKCLQRFNYYGNNLSNDSVKKVQIGSMKAYGLIFFIFATAIIGTALVISIFSLRNSRINGWRTASKHQVLFSTPCTVYWYHAWELAIHPDSHKITDKLTNIYSNIQLDQANATSSEIPLCLICFLLHLSMFLLWE